MGTNNKECCGGKPACNSVSNSAFVILILFILMAIIVGGRFYY